MAKAKSQDRNFQGRGSGARRSQARNLQSRNSRDKSLQGRSYALVFIVCCVIVVALVVAIVSVSYGKFVADNPGIPRAELQSGSADLGARPAANVAETAKPARSVKVTFAGDCTLGTDVNFDRSTSFNASFANHDPSYFLANVAPIFEADDLTIVNMEGTLTTSNSRRDKTFAFKGDADFAKVFSTSSVEAASMANNHSSDYGEQSYSDTLEALSKEGIEPFGYERIAYIDVNDVKVALIGAYELAQHEAIEEEMVARIKEAKDSGAEIVLVYIHWGVEREYVPNETQIKLGHAAIDAGADLVVGSHPHVIQGWEKYNGRYIVYSLGNFCFGGNSNPSDKDCMIFQQTFDIEGNQVAKNDEVEFIACSISSASGYNNYQPTPAKGSEKERIDNKIASSSQQISSLAANVP